jgi:hypothetical protein
MVGNGQIMAERGQIIAESGQLISRRHGKGLSLGKDGLSHH